MLVVDGRLSCQARENLRKSFEAADRADARVVVLEEVKVYQLVGGRWVPLDAADPPEPPPE